jgi:adenylosuccinate synthase
MKKTFIVTDLGYGDSGKGTITDALVREYDASLVVRYNGGAQAGHTVVAPDGREHTFNQFGSGTFVPGVNTFLSRYMLFNPIVLMYEEEKLRKLGIADAFERLWVDDTAIVTTPYHIYANRIKEYSRGNWKHGSCGMGIGDTASDAIDYPTQTLTIRDLCKKDILAKKMKWFQEHKQKQLKNILDTIAPPSGLVSDSIKLLSSKEELEASIEVYHSITEKMHMVTGKYLDWQLQNKTVVFEGAQGVLLDEDWGFYPYTTWSKTTPTNALKLIAEAGCTNETIIGVVRAYITRHGAGPFVTEDSSIDLPDTYNKFSPWQDNFRVGWFDAVAIRYAIESCERVDYLAITCLDRLKGLPSLKLCCEYNYNNPETGRYLGVMKRDILNMKKYKPVDLAYQTILGMILKDCKPVYQESSSIESLLFSIEKELKIPIGITSWGCQYIDKQFNLSVLLPVNELCISLSY